MKDSKLHEECGLFGIWNNDEFDCAHMTYYALYALQHRGQESALMQQIQRLRIHQNFPFDSSKCVGLPS